MTNLADFDQMYCCENCGFFDDDPVPGECRKGNGKVAYFHKICENFRLRNIAEENLFSGRED
jgi:hypothetical protein